MSSTDYEILLVLGLLDEDDEDKITSTTADEGDTKTP